jgi:hypothetical protein
MALLDCRDTRISLWQEQDTLHSPGFVLLDGSDYRFGAEALEHSRARPRDSNSRFWWQLSTQPLSPSLGAARHTADLVHSHLRHIHHAAGAPDKLAFAVPDSMPREQLSLLLGVAKACDFQVNGLVSRSVLCASASPLLADSSQLLHLEVQLHQAIVYELAVEAGQVKLLRSTPLPACGLLALQERCVSAIASAFIQQTRFDPRRSAGSEQTLYNQLNDILASLRERGEASIDVDGNRARVSASALASVSERLLAGLALARGKADLPVLLDPELQLLPGMDALEGKALSLGDSAIWEAFGQQREHIEQTGDNVHLIDKLPLLAASATRGSSAAAVATTETAEPAAAPGTQEVAAVSDATHVLLGTRALPLRGDEVSLGGGFSLRARNGHWTLQGDGGLVNGLPSTPQQPLHLGDTLSLGTTGHGRLIEVLG